MTTSTNTTSKEFNNPSACEDLAKGLDSVREKLTIFEITPESAYLVQHYRKALEDIAEKAHYSDPAHYYEARARIAAIFNPLPYVNHPLDYTREQVQSIFPDDIVLGDFRSNLRSDLTLTRDNLIDIVLDDLKTGTNSEISKILFGFTPIPEAFYYNPSHTRCGNPEDVRRYNAKQIIGQSRKLSYTRLFSLYDTKKKYEAALRDYSHASSDGSLKRLQDQIHMIESGKEVSASRIGAQIIDDNTIVMHLERLKELNKRPK